MMRYLIACLILLVTPYGYVLAAQNVTEVNDLNKALQLAIGELNDEGFFLSNWQNHFHQVLPIPVPNDCKGEKIPLDSADASLADVLNRGVLRVGIHRQLAGFPSFYSTLTNMNNNDTESAVDTKSTGGANWTLDLKEETLAGYEIDTARAVTKKLGDAYGVEVDTKFVIIEGTVFFNDLRDALNFEVIDAFFTALYRNENRSKEVDFVCTTFMTEYNIAGSANVSNDRPDPNGPAVEVLCFGSPCKFAVPPPFKLIQIDNSSLKTPLEMLVNTSDPYEYGMLNFDQIQMFINDRCPTCHFIDTEAIATVYVNPATKFVPKTDAMTTAATSVATSARFYVQAGIMILFTSISLMST